MDQADQAVKFMAQDKHKEAREILMCLGEVDSDIVKAHVQALQHILDKYDRSTTTEEKQLKKPLIIGVSGEIGSGKDTVTDRFLIPELENRQYRVQKLCFADALKVELIAKLGIDFAKIFTDRRDFEMRQLLQQYGTEEGRDKYGDDIWIKHLDAWMKLWMTRGYNCFIIADVRFPNEIQYVESLGGNVIRIKAASRTLIRMTQEAKDDPKKLADISTHRSETGLNMLSFKYTINNDINEESTVQHQVLTILNQVVQRGIN